MGVCRSLSLYVSECVSVGVCVSLDAFICFYLFKSLFLLIWICETGEESSLCLCVYFSQCVCVSVCVCGCVSV